MSTKTQHFDTRQHMHRSTYEIFRYRDAYLREVALHHHDFYEVYFFLSGNVQYNIESRSYRLAPGDILLIGPRELHQPVFEKEQRGYERIVLWINKAYLDGLTPGGESLSACFDNTAPGYSNLLRPDDSARQLLSFQLEELLREDGSEEYSSGYCALSYLIQILVILNRQAIKHRREPEGRVPSDSAVYRILGYINEHYSEELTLDSLATHFFLSKYHLSREFGRLVGTSVHRYIVQKRLAVACGLMLEGKPSSEVYLQCGFGDYSNFYRAFRAEYHMSPREFSARLKQIQPTEAEMAIFKPKDPRQAWG